MPWSNVGRISADVPRMDKVTSPENAVSSGLISMDVAASRINPAAG
jgi:hypothetical protein